MKHSHAPHRDAPPDAACVMRACGDIDAAGVTTDDRLPGSALSLPVPDVAPSRTSAAPPAPLRLIAFRLLRPPRDGLASPRKAIAVSAEPGQPSAIEFTLRV
jgi:hypothetical protein